MNCAASRSPEARDGFERSWRLFSHSSLTRASAVAAFLLSASATANELCSPTMPPKTDGSAALGCAATPASAPPAAVAGCARRSGGGKTEASRGPGASALFPAWEGDACACVASENRGRSQNQSAAAITTASAAAAARFISTLRPVPPRGAAGHPSSATGAQGPLRQRQWRGSARESASATSFSQASSCGKKGGVAGAESLAREVVCVDRRGALKSLLDS